MKLFFNTFGVVFFTNLFLIAYDNNTPYMYIYIQLNPTGLPLIEITKQRASWQSYICVSYFQEIYDMQRHSYR